MTGEERPDGEAPDETIVVPRRASGDPARTDEAPPSEDPVTDGTDTVEATVAMDETVAVPRRDAPPVPDEPSDPDATLVAQPLRSGPKPPERSRSTSRNPAPPVEDPELGSLPPELVAQMFKSPLDRRRKIPKAPSEAPEHAKPRGGLVRGLPIVRPTRFGAPPAAPATAPIPRVPEAALTPPAADRSGLRSTLRAKRRYGMGVLIGFAVTLCVSVVGLVFVARAVFGS